MAISSRDRLPFLMLLIACTDSALNSHDSAFVESAASDSDPDFTPEVPVPCTEVVAPEGDFIAQGSSIPLQLSNCQGVTLVTAGAVNQTLALSWTGEGTPTVEVYDVAAQLLSTQTVFSSPIFFQIWQSGEVFITIKPEDTATVSGSLQVSCTAECDREFTRYPIIFLHGMGGAGIFNGVDYFYQVRDMLEGKGYLVRNPSTEPFASTEERAEILEATLQEYIDSGVCRRFILVGHSQGGLDARALISSRSWGDRIVALDMISTPNRGSAVADVLTGTIEDGIVDAGMVDAGTAAFAAIFGIGTDEQSLTEAMGALTTESLESFNAVNLDDSRVYYRSWAGHSCGRLEPDCQEEHGGEVIELLMEPLYVILWAYGLANDGLVPVESAPWGDFQGELNADHLDEIGHFEDVDNPAFDHLDFYLSEIRTLAGMGF
jgi:triacylglycerol lipase